MSKAKHPRIGIIADTTLLRHGLQTAVVHYGFEVLINVAPENLEIETIKQHDADVWLIDLAMENNWDDLLGELLDVIESPVLFGEGEVLPHNSSHYPKWERRLFSKLRDLVGDVDLLENEEEELQNLESSIKPEVVEIELPPEIAANDQTGKVAERVWVLAASLGGPAAVKQFLDCLPPKLPVAFVYAQHIDSSFQHSLPQAVARHCHYPMKVGEEGDKLTYGQIYIAQVEQEIDFNEDGNIIETSRSWQEPYAPSIDQVISNVTKRYGKRSGALIFSGMGNDGSIAGPEMIKAGGLVWAQNSDSCGNSSQPDSMVQTGCVTYIGSPQELAVQFVNNIRRELLEETRQKKLKA